MNNKYTKLLISLVVTFLASVIGSVFTTSSISGWYSLLTKPSFNPPNWIFGPVWTLLFIMMAISAYLVWSKGHQRSNSGFLFFVIHLIVNVSWSLAFFTLHNPLLALYIIDLLWLFIIFLIVYFWKINRLSSFLLMPYLAWVSFASILNFYIFILN